MYLKSSWVGLKSVIAKKMFPLRLRLKQISLYIFLWTIYLSSVYVCLDNSNKRTYWCNDTFNNASDHINMIFRMCKNLKLGARLNLGVIIIIFICCYINRLIFCEFILLLMNLLLYYLFILLVKITMPIFQFSRTLQ